MAGSFGGSDEDSISGINVTPLVDVVLVLLVIFLMTAPVLYQSAIKVQLPKARTGEDAATKSPLNFTVSADGKVFWNAEELTWEKLNERLAAMGPKTADETAMISADQATPHGIVIKLMDALRSAGLVRFALNVEGTKK
ncbi:MAG: biopolymer transporter ExbD [Bdellovibrionales bacterium]|nr:biopolymer transporter ExbD [Bdellovibrionales bacterium]